MDISSREGIFISLYFITLGAEYRLCWLEFVIVDWSPHESFDLKYWNGHQTHKKGNIIIYLKMEDQLATRCLHKIIPIFLNWGCVSMYSSTSFLYQTLLFNYGRRDSLRYLTRFIVSQVLRWQSNQLMITLTQIVEILPHGGQGLVYLTHLIPWLLVAWRRKEPGQWPSSPTPLFTISISLTEKSCEVSKPRVGML